MKFDVLELRERLVARAGVHDPALARGADLGQERRPLRGGGLVAAAAGLRPADARVVGERVDLPDDGDLRPVPVVRRRLPDREQPRAELFHHRLVDVAEHLGEAIAAPRPQLDRLVQVQKRVAVVLLHVHDQHRRWLTLAPSERDTYGVICKGATLTPLANGFCFGEGPRWFEGLLWFSDMLGEAVHTVNLHGRHDHAAAGGPRAVRSGFPSRRVAVDRLDREPPGTALRRRHRRRLSPTCPTSCPRTSATWWSTTHGRAYVGSQAREGGVIVRVDARRHGRRRRRRPRLPQRDGDHARRQDADRRRVDRPAS